MMVWSLLLLLTPLAAEMAKEVNVLFTGNSFTYYSNLPELIKMMAEDRGHTFNYHKSLRGGSSLFGLMNNIPTGTPGLQGQFGLVDNLMNDSLSFDYVVMQDMSRLPTVLGARERLMLPTVERVAGLTKGRGKATKIISYMTWGYDQIDTRYKNTDVPLNVSTWGTPRPNFVNGCPTPLSRPIFYEPYDNLAELTWSSATNHTATCMLNSDYNETVSSKDCMQYTLARGYTETLRHGSDMLAPCGLAWQIVRGESDSCELGREIVDEQYDYDLPFSVPFPVELSDETKEILEAGIELQLDNGRNNHQDFTGQYLNALVFYTIMFGEDPLGLPAKSLLRHDRTNDDPPTWFWDYSNETWIVVPEGKAAALQEVASKLVYDNLDFWRNEVGNALGNEISKLEALRLEVEELKEKNKALSFMNKLLNARECDSEDQTCRNMAEGWPRAKKTRVVYASDECDCESKCKKLDSEGYVWIPMRLNTKGCRCLSKIKKNTFRKTNEMRYGRVYYQLY